MKRFCLLVAAIGIQVSPLSAQVRVFDHSGTIQDGDSYSYVVVHDTPPEQTILNMTGGEISGLGMQVSGNTIVNVSGGRVNSLNADNSSRVNISGGAIGGLNVTATAQILNGSVDVVSAYGDGVVDARGGIIASWLYVTDQSAVDINGALIGNADYTQDLVSLGGSGQLRLWNGNIRGNVSAGVASTVDLHGGTLDGYLRASDSSNVNIYGSVSSIEPAIAPGRFLMTGTWLDGVPFLLELYDSQTLSHINIVPEPSAFLILLAGCFLARTRQRAGQSPVQ